MTSVIQATRSEIAAKILKIQGHPLTLDERPYLRPIYNKEGLEILLMAGRQVEKSTTLGANMILDSILPYNKILYVAPTQNQVRVFSRAKLNEMYEDSLLNGSIYKKTNSAVMEKNLGNYATIYLRSAYRDADSIRGISARRIYVDEVQDIINDLLPVIDECASHYPDSCFFRAGTPKTMENTIQKKWEISTQNEWAVKCDCGKWVFFTDPKLIRPKEPGVFCPHCSRELDPRKGKWIIGQKNAEVLGYRLPQIILPKQFINWPRLWHKLKNYPIDRLMNEVFGISWDNATKPVTREQVIKCCDPNRENIITPKYCTKYRLFAGVDWGTGEVSYTALSIGYFDEKWKFHVVYNKLYEGVEASDKDQIIKDITNTVNAFGCYAVGVDWGFGWGVNQDLRKALSPKPVIEFYAHDTASKYAQSKDGKIVFNRTESMTEIFLAIKRQKISFPRWEDFMPYAEHILNIYIDYRLRTRKMYYDHQQDRPDDMFHAIMYSYLIGMILLGKIPLTRED